MVWFPLELGIANDAVAARLFADPSTSGQAQRVLRSGLYILCPAEQQNNAEKIKSSSFIGPRKALVTSWHDLKSIETV